MMISEPLARTTALQPDEASAGLLSEFKKAAVRGDPTALYQALILCGDHQLAMPDWLVDHLLKLTADFHLGKKPSWKGVGKRPLIVIRRRFENEVRRRAVIAVRAWVKDKSKYQDMPTPCIRAWNRQDYLHCEFQNDGDALEFASLGLRGIKLQADGPTMKCSPRTLRRVMEDKNAAQLPKLSGRIASVFGLVDPDDLFGSDEPLNPNLK
ncbi:hypothetical protein KUH32_18235 [Thalassococcus sp. CAU 1522]|uniref:Uncharacterized protein n=1 Tax=Thalassococcus arenae TaxID=2851652 RepID=A0ABS6NCF4_9RHOB|nr:hypothetical protein [Thalassococcus arenae]MBV2361709.1 hypothetical protein [Thalassococcus arenae]